MLQFDENGKYKLNKKYQAILKLDGMLTEAKIPHEIVRYIDGWQIIYPRNGNERVMDVIEHYGSYGQENDLLEIMGLLTEEEERCDSVAGWLTIDDVFGRIKAHWESNKPAEKGAI